MSSSAHRKINQYEIDYKNERNENVLSVADIGFNQLSFITFGWRCANLPMCECIFGALYSLHSFRVTQFEQLSELLT